MTGPADSIKFIGEQMNSMQDFINDQEGEIERLRSELVRKTSIVNRYRRTLVSIAANTCCDNCQEAALVAQEALSEPLAKLPGHDETMANLDALTIRQRRPCACLRRGGDPLGNCEECS